MDPFFSIRHVKQFHFTMVCVFVLRDVPTGPTVGQFWYPMNIWKWVVFPVKHCFQSCRVNRSTSSKPVRNYSIDRSNFRLYISAHSTRRCNRHNAIGYAAHCQQAFGTDRPIAGFINLCPDKLSSNFDLSQLAYFFRHEMLHLLGFSPSLFAFFREAESGKPLTSRLQLSGDPSLGWVPGHRWVSSN